MTIEQIIIAITGPLGFWLAIGRRGRWPAKAGLGIILFGQPFWILEACKASQWGILVVSLFWTACWIRAAWEEWRR